MDVYKMTDNELYDEAKKLVIADQIASVSYIQRKFQIGYNRAARLIERMEVEFVVSYPQQDGKRIVLKQAPTL